MNIAIINEHIEDTLGGSELQCDIIANELTELGHDVTYLAMRGSKDRYIRSYKVIPITEVNTDEFYSVIKKVNPDVIYWRYYKRKFYKTSKQLKILGYPIIFSVSHAEDLLKYNWKVFDKVKSLRELARSLRKFARNIYEYKGFKNVTVIANQCKAFMGKIRNVPEFYFPNSMFEEKNNFNWNKSYCVWVSNLKKRKNPDKYIDLARKFSSYDIDFLMVGEVQDSNYSFVSDPHQLPENVKYLGKKNIEEVNGIIEKSMFLIHTCNPEGFPNNFIQAWYYKKPVVSLFYDPDGLIEKERLGFYSKTENKFYDDVEKLLTDQSLREKLGANAKRISEELFDKNKNIKNLEKVMVTLTDERQPN
ncbi:MAG: glycosyltransferase family 4 protein [Balneolaceae bacterium]